MAEGLLKRKVKKLTSLRLKEISGVDHPASLHDGWMVMKSEDVSDEAEVENDNELEQAVIEVIETDTEDLENNVEIETAEEISEPETEIVEEQPELVAKELSDVRKELSDARAEIEKMRQDSEIEKAVRDSQRWGIIPELEPVEFAPVLRSIRSADSESASVIESILDAVAVALGEAGILKEIGSDGDAENAGDSFAQIQALASELVTSGQETSLQKAIVTVAQSNPELYSSYVAEMGA